MNLQDIAAALLAAEQGPDFQQYIAHIKPHIGINLLALLKERVDQERLRNPQDALRIVARMEALLPHIPDPEAQALVFWARGNCLYHLCDYQAALSYYHQAQTIYTRHDQPMAGVRLQINQVAVLNEIGDHQDALTLAQAARQICQYLGPPAQRYLALLEMNTGWAYYKMGQPEAALTAYDRSRAGFLALEDDIEAARVDVNRAIMLEEMGHFVEAEALLQQALGVLKAGSYDQEVARVKLNLGLLAHRRGYYHLALRYFEAAHSGFQTIENRVEVAVVDLHRAFVYRDLNLLAEMITLAAEAEAIFEAQQMHWQRALALINQGIGYQGLGAYETADDYLSQAHRILAQQNARVELWNLDLERAALALLQGQVDQAESLARSLLDPVNADEHPTLAARTYLVLAQTCLAQGGVSQAESAARRALTIAQTYDLSDMVMAAQHGLGQVLETLGQFEPAWVHYQAAIQAGEKMRLWIPFDELELGFMAEKLSIYQDTVRFCHRHGQPETLFETLNLAASAPLVRPSILLPDGSDEADGLETTALYERLRTVREAWRWFQQKLNQPDDLLAETLPEPSTADRAALRARRRQIETQLADLTRRLGIRTGPAALESSLETRTSEDLPFLARIQTRLTSGECLLHYYLVDDQIHGLLVSRQGVYHQINLMTTAQLERLVKAWRFYLAHRVLSLDQAEVQAAQTYLSRFYQSLVAPFDPHLTRVERLFLILPPVWHDLPLAGFFDGQTYLAARFQLSYLSAPEILLGTLAPIPVPAQTPLAALIGHSDGGYLAQAPLEAETVARYLPPHWAQILLLENEATLDRVKATLRESHLIHLATHAVFRPDNPLFSWIRLAEAELTVADLSMTTLLARPLVVLSACETGRGQPRGGGLLGMARGFLSAGAAGLVVSLWKVPDQAAAQFMGYFYENLTFSLAASPTTISAEAVSTALQAAQRRAIAQDVHPVVWAGFIFVKG